MIELLAVCSTKCSKNCVGIVQYFMKIDPFKILVTWLSQTAKIFLPNFDVFLELLFPGTVGGLKLRK